MPEKHDLKAEIESILFASAKIMSLDQLKELTNANEAKIRAAIEELTKDYSAKEGSLTLADYGNSWKLTVKDKYMGIVEKVVSETELPKSVLETLAVIAFKHPILQSDVIKIRSNKGYDHLKILEELGFIKREKHSRTNKIHLTQKFFDYFDLPPNRVKEAFSSFEAVSRAIDESEKDVETLKEAKESEEKAKIEVYERDEGFIKEEESFNESEFDPLHDIPIDENDLEYPDLEEKEPLPAERVPEENPAIPPKEDEEDIDEKDTEEVSIKKTKDQEYEKTGIISQGLIQDTSQKITVPQANKMEATSDQTKEEILEVDDYSDRDPSEIEREVQEELNERESTLENMSQEEKEVREVKNRIDKRADDLLKGIGKKDKERKDSLDMMTEELEKTKERLVK